MTLVPVGMVVIGLFLMIYYCVRMYRLLRGAGVSEAEMEDNDLTLMGGWAGGIIFVSGGALFLLPANSLNYIIPGAILLTLCWFPIVKLMTQLTNHSDGENQPDDDASDSKA